MIQTKKEIIRKIEKIKNKIIAVQALWDNDSNGWLLKLEAIFDVDKCHTIACLKSNSDQIVLSASVFSWSEVKLVQEIKKIVENEFDIPLYFTSYSPTLINFSWPEIRDSITCKNCKNLVLRPNKLCENCQFQQMLDNESTGSTGIELVVLNRENKIKNRYFSSFRSPFLNPVLKKIFYTYEGYRILRYLNPNINCQINKKQIISIKKVVEILLNKAVQTYQDIDCRLSMKKSISFLGKTIKIQVNYKEGRYLYSLWIINNLLDVALEKGSLYVVGNGNVSDKDLEVLLVIRKLGENIYMSQLRKKFFFLPKKYFLKKLKSLETCECIEISSNKLQLTLKGKVINIAGYHSPSFFQKCIKQF